MAAQQEERVFGKEVQNLHSTSAVDKSKPLRAPVRAATSSHLGQHGELMVACWGPCKSNCRQQQPIYP